MKIPHNASTSGHHRKGYALEHPLSHNQNEKNWGYASRDVHGKGNYAAIKENFTQVDEKSAIIKCRAVKLLHELNLCRLYNAVKTGRAFCYRPPSAKGPSNRKCRSVPSQLHWVSRFLQKQLKVLHLSD